MNNLSFEPMRCKILINSPLESRLVFEGIEENESEGGKKGIRFHNAITSFFLRALGKIVDVKDITGQVYQLNRESLGNWIRTNGFDVDKRFKANADFGSVTEIAMGNFLDEIIRTKSKKNPMAKKNVSIAESKNKIDRLETQIRIRDAANRPENWSEAEKNLEAGIEKEKWLLNMKENLPDEYLPFQKD